MMKKLQRLNLIGILALPPLAQVCDYRIKNNIG